MPRTKASFPMRYELRLATTSLGTGYFACYPPSANSFDENVDYLRSSPLDSFMHRRLTDQIGALDVQTVENILGMAWERDPMVMGLVYQAALSFSGLQDLARHFDRNRVESILPHTPLIQARAGLLEDRELQRKWAERFDKNMTEHLPLPDHEAIGLPILYSENVDPPLRSVHITGIHREITALRAIQKETKLPAAETAARALGKLKALHLLIGDEVAHKSSLSPHGFYRKWRLDLRVRNGRHDFSLIGVQTSYGKGLTPEAARASCSMEIVERVSSFASFGPEGALGYTGEYPLILATLAQLQQKGEKALDPNLLRLEAPYANEPLFWLKASERKPGASDTIAALIPAQSVFLFCNLDEIDLFSALGSTGLASGNTMEQAKVSALLEVIERDCEATTPFDPRGCFRIEPGDDDIGSLLATYREKGVHVQFQDLTAPMGVPCYKCFVADNSGRIYKGAGAHLDARKALVSALTETTYGPGPGSVPSVGMEGLAAIAAGDLPDFSTGSFAADLEILETLILANGYPIFYVDLTRKDIGIPVVRAIVPGMELSADFDGFSRISPRLFRKYLDSYEHGRLQNGARVL